MTVKGWLQVIQVLHGMVLRRGTVLALSCLLLFAVLLPGAVARGAERDVPQILEAHERRAAALSRRILRYDSERTVNPAVVGRAYIKEDLEAQRRTLQHVLEGEAGALREDLEQYDDRTRQQIERQFLDRERRLGEMIAAAEANPELLREYLGFEGTIELAFCSDEKVVRLVERDGRLLDGPIEDISPAAEPLRSHLALNHHPVRYRVYTKDHAVEYHETRDSLFVTPRETQSPPELLLLAGILPREWDLDGAPVSRNLDDGLTEALLEGGALGQVQLVFDRDLDWSVVRAKFFTAGCLRREIELGNHLLIGDTWLPTRITERQFTCDSENPGLRHVQTYTLREYGADRRLTIEEIEALPTTDETVVNGAGW